jgi:hypothetical protein
MATVDDIHQLLTVDNIDKKMGIILLRDWAQKLELNVIPSQGSD